ncbi:MAG: RNA polymerase sigma factor [Bryobacterales bacterium]|nr:RNA polymerase sigma factor [Bryobacterales bacterium]
MNENEFRSVFLDHQDAVYRFAWRMTNSPAAAEDVTQEAFLALLRHPARFDHSRGSLRAYLFGVARNLVLKHWRDERRWDRLEEDDFVAPTVAPGADAAEVVGAAVKALPPLQREVLVLAEYEELSLEEIAVAVTAEVGTVKSRLHRARVNLRGALSPLWEEMKGSANRRGTNE